MSWANLFWSWIMAMILGGNASRPSYIERTRCKEVYPLSNFGGQALMDMKYHLREWEVVGTAGKLNCHKGGSWPAVLHDTYPILVCSSDYVSNTLCRCCAEEEKGQDAKN